MKKSVTIYLPNGDVEGFTTGKGGTERIDLIGNGLLSITDTDGKEFVYSGMPFVLQQES